MAARKRYFRDANGRFAPRPAIPTLTETVPVFDYSRIDYEPAKPHGWLERALQWFTWNRSRA